ncbi:Transcriptional regulator WAR1 [Cytospora mali]|uniref:Transcriptional regulator WAR1 n=1 Tax=Cytospora mali TaxID=578113 RepID=A0A194VIN4_CYTMA|nr:Transcriptional regulator WAR1 [Valsa mali]
MSVQKSQAGMARSTATSQHAGTGMPAPYGHACTNCAKAKCKCVYRGTGGRLEICQRCFRLNKECQPSVPSRRRNHTKKTPGSRTAHLEEKLDDLVSLIRSQAVAKGANNAASTPPAPDVALDQPHTSSHVATVSSIPSGSSPRMVALPNPHTSDMWCIDNVTEEMTSTCRGPGSEYDHYIPHDIAEDSIAYFRRVSISFAPIVYISPTTSSEQLRQSRPLLWLSILSSTARSTKEAHAIGDRIRQIVSQKVLLEAERSMDLLQGLLVFLTWPHAHKKGNPFLSVWTNIGVGMAQDLGLTAMKGESSFMYAKKFALPGSRPQFSKERSMEERRTVLALFVWCNTVSQMLRRENTLPWTPHMEECLRVLVKHPEWEGDRVLAIRVRCALITEQLTSVLIQQALDSEPQTPLYFIRALDAQVQDVWRTLQESASISNNEYVLLHVYGIEVNVNELALNLEQSASNADVMVRVEKLHRCLKAIEKWFQIYERIPASMAIGITFDTFIQLVHCTVALIRLTRFDNFPAWDTAEVRRRLDIFSLLDRIADAMENLSTAAGIAEDDNGETSTWSRVVKGIRLLKLGTQGDFVTARDDIYTLKTKLDDMETIVTASTDGIAGVEAQQDAPIAGDVMTNFGDDPWLSAIFTPWDSMNF